MLVMLPFVLLQVVLPVVLPVMVDALLLGAAGDLDDDVLGHSGAVGGPGLSSPWITVLLLVTAVVVPLVMLVAVALVMIVLPVSVVLVTMVLL